MNQPHNNNNNNRKDQQCKIYLAIDAISVVSREYHLSRFNLFNNE